MHGENHRVKRLDGGGVENRVSVGVKRHRLVKVVVLSLAFIS